jgi:hypothetical protein
MTMINWPDRADAARMSDSKLMEKLRGFGLTGTRTELERLCEGALSAEEAADRILDAAGVLRGQPHEDWAWVCVLALWERWWPDRVCAELLDDKIGAGHEALIGRDVLAAASVWLDAWSDVMRLCDLTGIDSVRGFDRRFGLYHSLFNWSQLLEIELGNAGSEHPRFLRSRIAVCEEALRRFTADDAWMVSNRRCAIAESHIELGEPDTAEALYEAWLADDPRWGWGWIHWSDIHADGLGLRSDPARAEELLRCGYETPGVSDRPDIADRLVRLHGETGRAADADALLAGSQRPRRRRR